MTRRRSSLPRQRSTAPEVPAPKSIELEQRIGRLEIAVLDLQTLMEAYGRRTAAVQAQLDYIAAKLRT